MIVRSVLNKFTLLALLLSLFFVTQNSFSKPTYGIAFGYVPGYTSSTSGYSMNVADIPWSDLSHVSFFVVTITGTTPVISDPLGLYTALIAQAHAQSPNKVRCYMTVGGATQTSWPTSNANCITLADNIANMMVTAGFDGVDMDCEFPASSSAGTWPGTAAFSAMMDELKAKLTAHGTNSTCPPTFTGESQYGLTMYLSPGYDVCGYDFTHLNNDVDWYTLSGYDLNIGTSIAYQGSLVAPGTELFTNCNSVQMLRDITQVGSYYNTTGNTAPGTGTGASTVDYSKMILGMPLYGRDSVSPSNAGKSANDVFVSGTAGSYNTSRDEIPYTYGGQTYGMDNDQSFCDKINWAVGHMGMKGIAIFDLGQGLQHNDTTSGFTNTTLQNIWSAIGGSSACITVGTNPCAPAICTSTATSTATPSCGYLVTNFESGSAQNNLGGYCSNSSSGGTCTINGFSPSAGYGLGGSTYGARFFGTASGCTYGPEFLCPLQPTSSTNYYNASAKGENALQFKIKVTTGNSSGPSTFYVGALIGSCINEDYETTFVVPSAQVGTELTITVPFSQMTLGYSSCTPAVSPILDTSQLYQLFWEPAWTGSYDVTVDDIYFICAPTATPTPTMSATNTQTSTPTVASTSTQTATMTRTNTSSATATRTVTNTPSSTVTATQTSSATSTATQVDTNTPTNSATGVLNTATYTATQTPTGTNTTTPTNTSTDTVGATNTSTDTPNGPTNTQTNTASVTSTNTIGPTNTQTGTSTDTPANTSTSTPTGVSTATSTSTNTPPGPTSTSTNTATPTGTETSTPTSTNTNTQTVSATPSNTPTKTNTPTVTNTPTDTATITPTPITHPVFSPPFPNPSIGGPVEIDVTAPIGRTTVQMDVFTTAFRKISDQTTVYTSTGTKQAFQWNLHDKLGALAADGLYYIRIHVTGSQETIKIFKVLVLH